jgi:hypothetical protein
LLQQIVIKRIERLYRLRLFYGVHLAVFGMALILCALNTTVPYRLNSAALVLMVWLPVLLLHTAAQSYYELRERCAAYEPVPAPVFNRAMLPVDIYDEDGKLVSGGEPRIDLLPPRAGER